MSDTQTDPRIVIRDGREWYRERCIHWARAKRSAWETEPEIIRNMVLSGLERSAETQGVRIDPEATPEFHATDSRTDFFIANNVSVIGETWILLTKRQRWERDIASYTRMVEGYEQDLVDGTDYDGEPLADDERDFLTSRIASVRSDIERLEAELAAMPQ